MYYKIYFSPTGGTKRVIDILSRKISNDFIDIDLFHYDLRDLKLNKDDVCLFAFPSYGGRIPSICEDMLEKVNGNEAKAILIVSFGNRAIDDTLMQMYDILKSKNFKISSAVEAVTEHSLARIYGANRPDSNDEKQLLEFSKLIKENLNKEIDDSDIPGNHEYRTFNGVPFKPTTLDSCINCKKCIIECPTQAIDKDNPKLLDPNKCISCMHCISICPTNSKVLSLEMKKLAEEKLAAKCGGPRKDNKIYLAK